MISSNVQLVIDTGTETRAGAMGRRGYGYGCETKSDQLNPVRRRSLKPLAIANLRTRFPTFLYHLQNQPPTKI